MTDEPEQWDDPDGVWEDEAEVEDDGGEAPPISYTIISSTLLAVALWSYVVGDVRFSLAYFTLLAAYNLLHHLTNRVTPTNP